MSELTREQVELLFQQIWDLNDQASGEALLDHDQAQRQRIAELETDVNQLNNVLRQAGWGQGEIDSAAYTFDKLAKANSALVAERDRLKEGLEALDRMTKIHKIQDLDAHAVIYISLHGEPGGG